MKVLALDIATQMGCAFGRPLTTPAAWSVSFGELREHDARFAKALRFIRAMHMQLAPDLIAIEAPIGGKDASHYLIGLVAVMRAQAKDLGIQTVEYNIGSVRKHFIGKHFTKKDFPALTDTAATKIIKGKVLTRCRALGWQVQDFDQADACALWDYACARESTAHQVQNLPGLFQGKAR